MSTTSREFFEAKYRQESDPWQFAFSPYENSRYDATIESLGQRHYRRAYEPGCSIGMLTSRLAAICDQVDAMDISPTAVELACTHCRDLPNVMVTCGTLPDALPAHEYDLVVLSEIGYYFEKDTLRSIAADLMQRLTTPGTLIATHWLGHSADHVLTGDQVHDILSELPNLTRISSKRMASHSAGGYRIDRWDRL